MEQLLPDISYFSTSDIFVVCIVQFKSRIVYTCVWDDDLYCIPLINHGTIDTKLEVKLSCEDMGFTVKETHWVDIVVVRVECITAILVCVKH